MKLSFFEHVMLGINALLLVIQLMLMGSIPSFFDFSILNLFIPIIVIINLFLFCYWVLQFKWPFLFFLAAFLIGYNEWNLLYQFPKTTLRKSSATFSVMSYNVRLFNQYKWIDTDSVPQKIEALILEKNPDVVCLQEYSKTEAPRLEAYEFRYIQPSRGVQKSPIAIFSKFPILDQGYIDFSESTNSGSYIEISFRNRPLRIYNLHFESFRINAQDSLFTNVDSSALQLKFDEVFQKQLTQIEQFRAIEANNQHPSIICTDLNNTQFSKTYKAITKNKIDAFTVAGKGLGETFYFSSFPLRIDFIFTHPAFKINTFEVIPVSYSDHFPILTHVGLD